MKNTRAFNVRWMPWSEKKPGRVRIEDHRFKKVVFVSVTDSITDRVECIANEYLQSKNIRCTFMAQDKKGFILATTNFKDQIK